MEELSSKSDIDEYWSTPGQEQHQIYLFHFTLPATFSPDFVVRNMSTTHIEDEVDFSIEQDEEDPELFHVDTVIPAPHLSMGEESFTTDHTQWNVDLTKKTGEYTWDLSAVLPQTTLEIGSVTTGEPDVELVADPTGSTRYIMNITLPDPVESQFDIKSVTLSSTADDWGATIEEDTNTPGLWNIDFTLPSPDISIGSVTAVPYGEGSDANLTQQAHDTSWILDLTLETGPTGATGPPSGPIAPPTNPPTGPITSYPTPQDPTDVTDASYDFPTIRLYPDRQTDPDNMVVIVPDNDSNLHIVDKDSQYTKLDSR